MAPEFLLILLHNGIEMHVRNLDDTNSIEILFVKNSCKHKFSIDSVSLSLYKENVTKLIIDELYLFLNRLPVTTKD